MPSNQPDTTTDTEEIETPAPQPLPVPPGKWNTPEDVEKARLAATKKALSEWIARNPGGPKPEQEK